MTWNFFIFISNFFKISFDIHCRDPSLSDTTNKSIGFILLCHKAMLWNPSLDEIQNIFPSLLRVDVYVLVMTMLLAWIKQMRVDCFMTLALEQNKSANSRGICSAWPVLFELLAPLPFPADIAPLGGPITTVYLICGGFNTLTVQRRDIWERRWGLSIIDQDGCRWCFSDCL